MTIATTTRITIILQAFEVTSIQIDTLFLLLYFPLERLCEQIRLMCMRSHVYLFDCVIAPHL